MKRNEKVGFVFDMDGTLINSVPLLYSGMCAVFRHCSLESPPLVEYLCECAPPWMPFYERRGVRLSRKELFAIYNRASDTSEAEAFPDVEPTLDELCREGIPIGAVSSQREMVVAAYRARIPQLKNGAFVVGGVDDKAPAIREFCRKYCLPPSRVFVVGDFTSDMWDARRARGRGVGIIRGNGTRDALLAAGAYFCIETLESLPPMLGCIELPQ
jgi:phosphoglycolate phosphatase-like HAD superfamily hydrolase